MGGVDATGPNTLFKMVEINAVMLENDDGVGVFVSRAGYEGTVPRSIVR